MITVADEDRKKCELYAEFYQKSRKDLMLIDERGHPNVGYWIAAREYVEPRLRAWKEEQTRKRTRPIQSEILAMRQHH